MDNVCRVTVLLEDSNKVVNFLLRVVLHVDDLSGPVDDLSGPVMETSHHTSLYVGRMMVLEVEILVRVRGLPVDRDIQVAMVSSPE